jgi:hypothetical protein
MDDLKVEIWYEMQKTLFVENTAVFLASTDAASVLSQDGKKYHKPILSKARTGTYTPYQDITYKQQSASKQTLEVDTYEYGAEEIDWTDKKQTGKYDPVAFSATSMQRNLNTRIEQNFLSKVTGAKHVIDGETMGGAASSLVDFSGPTIMDVFESAESKLSSADVPQSDRVAVFGPHAISAMRKLKTQRETPVGDSVMTNGVVGPWNGWTLVQNNNLPYSATFNMATQPTDGDTVTIAGVTFTFRASPSAAGDVDIGADADASRANLAAAINDSGTAGTTYIQLGTEDSFILREKRHVRATNNNSPNTMTITGYGDIVVSETMTATSDGWTDQKQDAYMGVRGAIDLVVQIDPSDIRIIEKEKGFADLVKSLLGMGAKMFDDGARASIDLKVDASNWK